MLSPRQRLVGLYILHGIYLHESNEEDVTTTPFYQLVLDLLSRADTLPLPEQKLLLCFLRSVPPRVGKQTPAEYIKEAEDEGAVAETSGSKNKHKKKAEEKSTLRKASLIHVLDDPEDEEKGEGWEKRPRKHRKYVLLQNSMIVI